MNEYQDQATWFEIQIRGAYGRWISITDESGTVLTYDTRDEAEAASREDVRADIPSQVVKRTGLA